MNTTTRPAALATTLSVFLLTGALFFQYVMGLEPCALCLIQRIPHGLLVALFPIFLTWKSARVSLSKIGVLFGLAAFGTAAYHAGVEYGWWANAVSCANIDWSGTSQDLLSRIENTTPKDCAAVAWSLLGISMAGWNALFSLVIVFFWFAQAKNQHIKT